MAKVTNPAMSFGASGQVGQNGNGLVFYKRGGQYYVKTAPPGTNSSNSAAQQVIRGYFTDAVNAWHAETSTVRTSWSDYAKAHTPTESGFNLYVGVYVSFLVAHSGTPPTVTNAPPTMS